MFIRQKKTKYHTYVQLVESRREDGKVKQHVIATLGRLEEIEARGGLDGLAQSAGKLCESVMVLDAHAKGEAPVIQSRRIGPGMVVERLWRDAGIDQVISELAQERCFGFSLERAVFTTVVNRLFSPGSDRSAERWKRDYHLRGSEEIKLHHLYRAMQWLGTELPERKQKGRTPHAPRCVKDLIEEKLFERRRNLFTDLALVLMDSTSIFFYGQGGKTLGKRGYSRDNRPELKQMVVAMIVDENGYPLCCELWPGNVGDINSLVPVVDRLRLKFGIHEICIVADRGMLSTETIKQLESEERGWNYILGTRMRKQKEVTCDVLRRGGAYRQIERARREPLKVKEVRVGDRRYVVCLNEAQKRRDQRARAAMLEKLAQKLKHGDKALVGNTGFRRYLARTGKHFTLDAAAIKREERYDGKFVLRTNTDWSADEVALRYKQLWMVERIFRDMKSLLDTRPIFHKTDEGIRGHVFCSFLALVVRKELFDRLPPSPDSPPLNWREIVRDLDALTATDVTKDQTTYRLRSALQGCASRVLRALHLAIPPTVQKMP